MLFLSREQNPQIFEVLCRQSSSRCAEKTINEIKQLHEKQHLVLCLRRNRSFMKDFMFPRFIYLFCIE